MPQRLFRSISALLCVFLASCATLEGPTEAHDPWERFNRSMYNFNDKLDRALVKPVTKGYRAVTPDIAEKGISNFFANLGTVNTIVNDLLQFKLLQTLSDTGRLLVNSTLGIGGLFDVATSMGMPEHEEDFGQTMGYWGINNGPYLVLPALGPSSIRDGIGLLGDWQFNPINEVDDDGARYGLYTLGFIDTRSRLLVAGEIIDEAALDPYIYMREAYLTARRNRVYDGNPPIEEDDEEFDIFADDD